MGLPAPVALTFEALDRLSVQGACDDPMGVDGREAATRAAHEVVNLPVLRSEGRGPEGSPWEVPIEEGARCGRCGALGESFDAEAELELGPGWVDVCARVARDSGDGPGGVCAEGGRTLCPRTCSEEVPVLDPSGRMRSVFVGEEDLGLRGGRGTGISNSRSINLNTLSGSSGDQVTRSGT